MIHTATSSLVARSVFWSQSPSLLSSSSVHATRRIRGYKRTSLLFHPSDVSCITCSCRASTFHLLFWFGTATTVCYHQKAWDWDGDSCPCVAGCAICNRRTNARTLQSPLSCAQQTATPIDYREEQHNAPKSSPPGRGQAGGRSGPARSD